MSRAADDFIIEGFRPPRAPPHDRSPRVFEDDSGAAMPRLGLVLAALAPYVQEAGRWHEIWLIASGVGRLLMLLLLFALLFEPVALVYYVAFKAFLFCVRSVDRLLFALPRRVLRDRAKLGPAAAFALSFALELGSVSLAVFLITRHKG